MNKLREILQYKRMYPEAMGIAEWQRGSLATYDMIELLTILIKQPLKIGIVCWLLSIKLRARLRRNYVIKY